MPTALAPQDADTKPTVLIVDDEAAPRAALTHILRKDFNILTADDARSALAVLNDHGVDLVTLDLKLPDRSGSDLLREIKQTHREIEVIMVTAYGTLQSAMDCIRQGAAGFLLKPFNASEMLTISLQTSHKKQRLDLLRSAFTQEPGLWGPESSSKAAWQSLIARYANLTKNTTAASAGNDPPSPLIQLVSDLLEAKDRHLVNHGNRVSFYATLVANKLEWPLAEQHMVSLGALAHDLDLIQTPDVGALAADQERQRHHPEIGARLGRAIGLPSDAVQVMALHHERWDGTGYPFGLAGERIPAPARLVAIAQAFDELTAEQPGQPTMPMQAALEQIEAQAGQAFDPSLVEVFCKTLREQPPQ